ncbi:VWA domain-containing protein [Tabrizicola sp.]|uniref:vWA domain-containing protein n=1 Tax=Tabrizicola sp. TaxID=2005166 RepID=UPI00286A2DA6|nr:VWA domain-containing protein [Tabrizicola sp.]
MRLVPFFLAALLAPAIACAEGKSIIVLDASGSMWGQIDGRAKLEIAREALGSVLAGIPAEAEIGLMAYGHREKGSCDDIELVVPPGPGTAAAITEAANTMKFLGKTPLSEAVRRAAAELKSTEEKATVILITDGIETCEADPCALGAELEASGVDFTAHVVGFGLTEEEGKAVACLAENTGGKYIQAADAGSLVEALKTTVVVAEHEPEPLPEPEPPALADNVDPDALLVAGGPEMDDRILQDVVFSFTPVGEDGVPVGDSYTIYGRSKGALAEGKYLMVTELHDARVEQIVEIGPISTLSTPVAVLDAGVLNITLRPSPGAEPDPDAFWEMRGPNDVTESNYAKGYRVFPAGEYALSVRLGAAEMTQSVVIEAGKVLDLDLVVGVGLAVVEASYAEGVMVEGAEQFVEIFEAKKAIDGTRKSVAYTYGAGADFDLPAGDYVAAVTLGAASVEVPFTIKVGERVDIVVPLNAGVVAVTTPSDQFIEVLAAKPDINGNRASFAYSYGPNWLTTLPAGDYVVTTKKDDKTTETPFTVVAGERVELALTE